MGSHLESQVGSRQSHPGSQLHSRQNPANPAWDPASNPRWDPSFVPGKIPPIPPSNLCLSQVGSCQSQLGNPNLYHMRSQVGSCNLTSGHLFLTQTGSHLLSFLIYPQIPVPALEHVYVRKIQNSSTLCYI